ncbi:hypothetical protein HU200_065352 [Digitaria exilis]|uniref:Uncharacterized protein n=1 Tax=Digitaria exilis TaxID=1010633 RepID=A0A834ZYP2_9POAL|nr:hypothetical protein HU200_065352 [Digitaria exilis]
MVLRRWMNASFSFGHLRRRITSLFSGGSLLLLTHHLGLMRRRKKPLRDVWKHHRYAIVVILLRFIAP